MRRNAAKASKSAKASLAAEVENDKDVRKFSVRYFTALALVCLLIVLAQFLTQSTLWEQSDDSRIINIAGRQRMLSQRIARYALAMRVAENDQAWAVDRAVLREALALWLESHAMLSRKFRSSRFLDTHEETLLHHLETMNIHLGRIKNSVNLLLTMRRGDPRINNVVATVLANDGSFLKHMNAIVFIYDDESANRVRFTQYSQFALAALMLFVLLAEGLLVIRPSLRKIRSHFRKIIERDRDKETLSIQLELQNETLAQSLQRAEHLAQSKTDFLANMSHEIRTPMNAVIGMATLLADTSLSQEQRDYVNTIRSGGDTLLSLINDILDFSKIEAGKVELEKNLISVRDLVEDVTELLAAQRRREEVELIHDIDVAVPLEILGDPTRLRQILINLTNNALKFTEEGEVCISVRLHSEQNTLRFSVRDTGVGIPEDRMHRLFRDFSQVDASVSRQYGGTGLGLAICKKLTELMGGKIWVESEAGKGSEFSFTLPFDSRATTQVSPLDTQTIYSELVGKRLLVVDDNATNRRVVRNLAGRWGFVVDEADSAAATFEKISGGLDYDIAVLDVQMPGMDGIALAQELRRRFLPEALPIVFLTSLGSQPSAVSKIKNIKYLHKPVRAARLQRALREMLGLPVEADHDEPTISARALPATASQPAAPKAKTPSMRAAAKTSESRLCLLLAEDNPINQKVAIGLLSKLALYPDIANNGREAIEALEKKPYEVILMDVQMPEMDGLQAARQIRERWSDGRGPHIIALTAGATSSDKKSCLDAGMDQFLTKPVTMRALEDALRPFLDKKGKSLQPAAQSPSLTKNEKQASQGITQHFSATEFRNSLAEIMGKEDVEHDLQTSILSTFVNDVPTSLQRLSALRKEKNDRGARFVIHGLRTNLSMLGVDNIPDDESQFEALLHHVRGDVKAHLEGPPSSEVTRPSSLSL